MLFCVDENIPHELVGWLKKKGHEVFSLPKGAADEEIANAAKKRAAVLLTQDRHFANTLRFPPVNFQGIVRIKIHPAFIEDIAFSLTNLLSRFTSREDFKGKLIILEKDGFFKLKE